MHRIEPYVLPGDFGNFSGFNFAAVSLPDSQPQGADCFVGAASYQNSAGKAKELFLRRVLTFKRRGDGPCGDSLRTGRKFESYAA